MRAKSWDGMRLALGVNDLWNSFCTWADCNGVGTHQDDWEPWWQCYRAGASCGISPEQPEPGEIW